MSQAKPSVDLVVVDLDNTLYDWVGAFVPSLYEMVDVAGAILGIGPDQLLDELQTVHRRHADSEHPFALLETASVAARFPGGPIDSMAALDPAFHAFNRTRKKSLRLYDGVERTLEEISRRAEIVAYTDARVSSALFRIEKLGLNRFLSRLYTPAKRHLAEAPPPGGFVRILDPEDRKPNPRVLRRICRSFGIAPRRTLYVGDSLARDIRMAAVAGCRTAWARYGTLVDPELGAMLLRVSHWTAEDAARDRILRANAAGIRPDCVLDGFAELLDHFDIGKGQRRRPAPGRTPRDPPDRQSGLSDGGGATTGVS